MRFSIAALLLALMTGCASQEPDYYTLSEVNGVVRDGPRISIEIHRPGVGAYLDRPEMVDTSGYAVARDERHYWAEPLDGMIGRVLAQDVSQRLQGSSVFAESGGLNANADYTVDVSIPQIQNDKGGHALMLAQFSIRSRSGQACVQLPSFALQAEPASTGASLARAGSILVGQLADRIAARLQSVSRQGCP